MKEHLEDWAWAQTVVRFTDRRPPDAVVQSVRAIAVVDHGVVVCGLADGTRFIPGGTREDGEPVDDCIIRELAEEAGFRARGRPHWFAAHSGVSYHRIAYRPYSPFPLKAWLWGVVTGDIVGAPTNPVGAEQVATVSVMRPEDAVAVLEGEGRGYAQVLRHWMSMGAPSGF